MANKDKLYVKRYKTLKEHRAAVKARKLLDKGKNKGPVANNDAYGETIKKPKPTPARPSTPTRALRRAPTRSTPEPARPDSLRNLGKRPVPTKTPPKETPKKTQPPKRGTARGGSRASNNNRGLPKTSSGPKAGDTRRIRKGSKYVTQMYNGKKWVTGKVGGKG